MLKALFLDMDDTLCDTQQANREATQKLVTAFQQRYGKTAAAEQLAKDYVKGIYREWTSDQEEKYTELLKECSEEHYRIVLIQDIVKDAGLGDIDSAQALQLQNKFDQDRLDSFRFFPGIKEFLIEARKYFTLVVITNGPEYSQLPKLAAVQMEEYVDHILVGGQEPEQKPAASIFFKALGLAGCEAHEVVHVGDNLAADIQGAHNSGITSVWIQHQQPLDAELGIDPHHTVLHPSEIPELIKQLHPY
ncbi:HAD family hydrolase [Halioxenophilus aromaticivorans]|uniref:HAD family hydrolase n=1 Tax=Halioxenophilus aromaticivorans TaxID=1306992 RepID=A0AAV3U367_9ALTE